MASDPHGDWPDRTPLYDEAGDLQMMFTLAESTRSGRPWVDGVWRPEDVPLDTARELALTTFAGHAFSSSDRQLVDALLGADATELRHAHTMSHPLGPVQPVEIDGLRITELTAKGLASRADDLAEIAFRAYPAEHPDHDHDTVASVAEELHAISRGELLGPYLDVSRLATTTDGAVLGACLIVDRDGTAPDGGPWIIDVFRDPATTVKGIGPALISTALAAARDAGLPSVSLAVSHSNANALALYSSLGFVDADENWTLALP